MSKTDIFTTSAAVAVLALWVALMLAGVIAS